METSPQNGGGDMPQLDFNRIKAIPITDVCGRYGIRLRFNGEWGSAPCPLPTHKPGDKDKTFQVSTDPSKNYWKCWSESCNQKAGAKGGDVINFVALKEGISQYDAAKKLAEWFHVDGNVTTSKSESATKSATKEKPARHIAERVDKKQTSQETVSQSTVSSDSVKPDTKGYMADVDSWLDVLLEKNPGEDAASYRKRVHNAIKGRLIESFRNGKGKSLGLPAQ